MRSPSWLTVVAAAWEHGQQLGSVGPGDVRTHLDHADGLVAIVGTPPTSVLDLGTGGGIPGLALAGRWPETTVALLDASQRRLVPVETAIQTLGWQDRVSVLHGRAEVLGHNPDLRGQFELVVCRLFGPAATTAECAAPFVSPGGRILVCETPDAAVVDRWGQLEASPLGLVPGPLVSEPVMAQWLHPVEALDETYPR